MILTIFLKETLKNSFSAKIRKRSQSLYSAMGKRKNFYENGRWGPFIKFGKGMFKIPKKEDGSKYEAEELQTVSLDEVKKWITAIRIKQLLLKRKNLRQRKQLLKNLQRRRNNLSRNVAKILRNERKDFYKILSIGADFSPLFLIGKLFGFSQNFKFFR